MVSTYPSIPWISLNLSGLSCVCVSFRTCARRLMWAKDYSSMDDQWTCNIWLVIYTLAMLPVEIGMIFLLYGQNSQFCWRILHCHKGKTRALCFSCKINSIGYLKKKGNEQFCYEDNTIDQAWAFICCLMHVLNWCNVGLFVVFYILQLFYVFVYLFPIVDPNLQGILCDAEFISVIQNVRSLMGMSDNFLWQKHIWCFSWWAWSGIALA